jgi:hypothetical protein
MMRTSLLIVVGFIAIAPAEAEPANRFAVERPQAEKTVPLKGRTAGGNPCAVYGARFVRVEGTSTCVKLGGSIDVGVAVTTHR